MWVVVGGMEVVIYVGDVVDGEEVDVDVFLFGGEVVCRCGVEYLEVVVEDFYCFYYWYFEVQVWFDV